MRRSIPFRTSSVSAFAVAVFVIAQSGNISAQTSRATRTSFEAKELLLNNDGSIVVVGSGYFGASKSDIVIVRLRPDGAIDNAFGKNGFAFSDIANDSSDVAEAASLQPDGKILVGGWIASGKEMPAGFSNNDLLLLRYNSDGSIDKSFGSNGKVVTSFSADTSEWLRAISIQPDGKIVAAATVHDGSSNDFAVVRFNPDGSLDTRFGLNGKVKTVVSRLGDLVRSVALGQDGKILVAGETTTERRTDVAIVRYNGDGFLDKTFNGSGILTLGVGKNIDIGIWVAGMADAGLAIGIRSWGVMTGDIGQSVSSGDSVAVVRLTADGRMDESFGKNGIASEMIKARTRVWAEDGAVAENGLIVIAGNVYNGYTVPTNLVMARFRKTGALDTSFGNGGKVITNPGPGAIVGNALTLQKDGKILVAGSTAGPTGTVFAVARFAENGTPDPTFGKAGKATLAPSPSLVAK
ncbi:MAG TPA: hypothetical protein VJ781_02930 [Pyrinomonadaceae bacterium]|nr:hypothetical protein [Pyrinomonadaceae bacterium]